MPFKPIGADENGNFAPKIEAALKQKIENNPKVSGAKTQSILLGTALRKLRKGDPFKMVVRGDSTTYGHDTVSADKVAAPTTTLPDGSKHSFTRSPKPYPDALQDCLRSAFGRTNITVENQGYSGDHVARGYDRWLNNVSADITVISYGINDASASYVPDDKRGNVTAFVEDTEKMILRDLAWGSAVVLLTPTRQLGQQGNVDTDTFRNAWYSLAMKYGIPVIDGEMFLDTQQRDAWSDGNHLTTKGNYVMGARLAAVFLAENPLAPTKVSGGSKLLARPTMHGFVKHPLDGYSASNGYPTPEDNGVDSGSAIGLNNGGGSVWTFYADTPDLYVVPSSYLSGTTGETGLQIEYILDFDASAGDSYNDAAAGASGTVWPDVDNSTIHGPITGTATSYNATNPAAGVFLRIPTPGWHTIRAVATKSNDVSTAVVHNLEFVDYRVWKSTRDDNANNSRLTAVETLAAVKGSYLKAEPASYNETTNSDILSTKVSWPSVVSAVYGKVWNPDYYTFPPMRLTVTSYNGAIMEYLLLASVRSDVAQADVPALAVDAATISGGSKLNALKLIRATNIVGNYGGNTQARVLQSVQFVGATNELQLNWKTTLDDGTTPREMKRNFNIAFTTV